MIILPCLDIFFTGPTYLFHAFWLMFLFGMLFKLWGAVI